MSATDQDFSTCLLPRVEFYVDRLKALAVGGGAIAAGLLIASPPAAYQSLHGRFPQGVAAVFALAGAAVLVAAGLYVLMRILPWRGPAIVIDGFGIHDRRAGPVATPWARVHDVRVLDRHGHHIGIDTLDSDGSRPPPTRRSWCAPMSRIGLRHAEPITVIDTFFLRSITGNRVLDFILPLTAMTPVDMSETPVGDASLAADAAFTRKRMYLLLAFVLAAGILPASASILLLI